MDQVDLLVIRNFLTNELQGGVSKRSCKRRLSALKHFYGFMVGADYVTANPFSLITAPKTDKRYPHFSIKNRLVIFLRLIFVGMTSLQSATKQY